MRKFPRFLFLFKTAVYLNVRPTVTIIESMFHFKPTEEFCKYIYIYIYIYNILGMANNKVKVLNVRSIIEYNNCFTL